MNIKINKFDSYQHGQSLQLYSMFCFSQRIAQDAITAMGDMGRNARVSTRVSVGTRYSVYLIFFLVYHISELKFTSISRSYFISTYI